jgi:hypothetical protein
MASTMVVIRGKWNLAVIRQGVSYLMDNNVSRFNDGMYHISLSIASFREFMGAFSEADAVNAGFKRLDSPANIVVEFGGLRWETDPKATELRIFGPKSDPANPLVINLTDEVPGPVAPPQPKVPMRG